jgi:hypothetical protein
MQVCNYIWEKFQTLASGCIDRTLDPPIQRTAPLAVSLGMHLLLFRSGRRVCSSRVDSWRVCGSASITGAGGRCPNFQLVLSVAWIERRRKASTTSEHGRERRDMRAHGGGLGGGRRGDNVYQDMCASRRGNRREGETRGLLRANLDRGSSLRRSTTPVRSDCLWGRFGRG